VTCLAIILVSCLVGAWAEHHAPAGVSRPERPAKGFSPGDAADVATSAVAASWGLLWLALAVSPVVALVWWCAR
jgi:hypothetical protein